MKTVAPATTIVHEIKKPRFQLDDEKRDILQVSLEVVASKAIGREELYIYIIVFFLQSMRFP